MGRYQMCGIGTDFNSRAWLSLDPCGLVCVTLSVSVHVFAAVAAGMFLISHHLLAQILYGALFVPFSLLALASLFMAATTDPGSVPMGARPLAANIEAESDSLQMERDSAKSGSFQRRRGIRRCRKCNDNYKPPRAHHDSVTGRCVVKMDHYCPWVCNAVGIMNHKFFILFILYTFLTAVVSLTLILVRVVRCGFYTEPSKGGHNYTGFDDPDGDRSFFLGDSPGNTQEHVYPGCDTLQNPVVGALAVVTVLFFFFTCCMLLEQGEAVDTNMSKIARMKMRSGMAQPGEYAPVATEFNEVFGGEHPTISWHWFLPLPVRFPEWARENVLGYEWDLTFDSTPYQEPISEVEGGESVASLGRNEARKDAPLSVPRGDDAEIGVERSTLEQEQHVDRQILPPNEENPVKKRTVPPLGQRFV